MQARKLLLLVCLLFNLNFAVQAEQHVNADVLEVTNAWARETFAMAQTGAAYLQLKNHADFPVRLVDASVSPDVADEVQIHDVKMQDDMMRMFELSDGVLIPAQSEVHFQSGGKHIMLMGLAGPLKQGQQFALTLLFDNDVSKTINVEVKDVRGKQGMHH